MALQKFQLQLLIILKPKYSSGEIEADARFTRMSLLMNTLNNGQMKSGQPIGVNKYFYYLMPANKAPI